jgi:Tol biopolymer transport system component
VVASTPWGNADTVTVFVTGSILVASTRGGSADIFAFDPGTPADFQPVVSSPAREYSPAYSPDGTRLAFATDRDGNAEIYVADVDGQHVTRLTDTPATEDDPSWTADGRRLVYMSNADGTVQIWSMSADGSDQRQLTRGAGLSQGPVVSPGGGRVAFTTTRDGNYDVYVMELDGSNARNVTASPSNEIAVQWVGDSALAFLREERSGAAVTRMVMRMPLAGGVAASLTPSQLLIREFAITPDGGLVVAVVETPGPSGTAVFRLFLIPADGAVPTEVPRSGDRDLLVTPAVRR